MRKFQCYILCLATILLLASCGNPTSSISATTSSTGTPPTTTPQNITQPATSTTAALTTPKHPHVFLIVMENLGYRAAMATPELSTLAHQWAYASNYYATTHPSLPNYLSLIGGSTYGISSDCTACFVNSSNLPTELSHAGISWSAYMESIPKDCYLSPYAPGGLYAGKHDPFIYFDNVRATSSLCRNIRPLNQLTSQLSNPSANLSSFSWITPNLCNDGHNCSPTTAGRWLDKMVNQIVSSAAWKNNGALYITWDEGNGGDTRGLSSSGSISPTGGGGHVLTLVIEPGLAKGLTLSSNLDHYALLKTIEVNFGVSQLGESANPKLGMVP
ncbi:MAG: hypothetical protein HKL84_02740 [Acidimicrobiaceae bacterium]|nr:hypothetical protein [Acidimicrobiaceae bacterium]